MASVAGVFSSILDILAAFSPMGIDPILFWLTFLLSFGLIFLLLQLLPLFKEKTGISAIVGFVMSYFIASSSFAVILISRLFPSVGIVLMGALGLLMVVAIISPKSVSEGTFTGAPIIIILAFLVVIWITYIAVAPELQAAGAIPGTPGMSFSSEDIAIIVVILIVLGVIWTIFKSPEKKKKGPRGKEFFKWMFGDKW